MEHILNLFKVAYNLPFLIICKLALLGFEDNIKTIAEIMQAKTILKKNARGLDSLNVIKTVHTAIKDRKSVIIVLNICGIFFIFINIVIDKLYQKYPCNAQKFMIEYIYMRKVGIFGGSFNPVHLEHVNMVEAFINELGLDKMIIVPANIPPHKKNEEIISSQDRINMLKLAFSKFNNVEISSFEVESSEISYTYKTLEHFSKRFCDSQIYFLLGTDMLADFYTWKKPERILELATLALVRRTGDDERQAEDIYFSHFSKEFVKLKYIGENVSSTAIRASIALELPVEGVPEEVLKYIESKQLYKTDISRYVVKNLPIKRLTHTFGVVKLAVRYAKRLKENATNAYYAAMLHDVAKYLDYRDFEFQMEEGVPKPCEHQFLGAYIAENVLNIKNKDIINAIKYHTTGRADMSKLEQIVFLADLLEEGRTFEGVERLRDLTEQNFDLGFKVAINELYAHLSESNEQVFYLTCECKNFYNKKNNI